MLTLALFFERHGGDVLDQTDKQHTEVGLPHIQGWIEGESFITRAEKAEQKEDDIGELTRRY